ncbi:MAG: copper resistance CopC family protein [Kibdelosporangium sp.]
MIRRSAVVAVLAGLVLTGLATPALAHNSLVDSNPKDKTLVAAGPQTIELTFDQPVQPGQEWNTLAVVGPNGDHWESGPATVADTKVTAPVRPLGPAGEYSVGYRILSADGHPVQGSLKFTLSTAGTGTPTPPEEVAEFTGRTDGQAAPGDAGSGGVPTWVWIVGAIVLLGAGVVFAMRMGGKEENP